MATRKRPSKETIIEAMKDSGGIITTIAEKLGYCRQSVTKWISEDEELQKALDNSINIIGDKLERNAFDMAMDGSERMNMFLLKTKFKDRGYTETMETKDVSDKPRVIQVLNEKDVENEEALE